MEKDFHDRVWIGDEFMDPDDLSELLPDDFFEKRKGMMEGNEDEDKLIEAQVYLHAKEKLGKETQQELKKLTKFFCPVCKRAGRHPHFASRTAFLQHLRTFATLLRHHHRGYYKAFEEVFKEGGHQSPAAPPMKTELLKRKEETIVWPPVLLMRVACERKVDELLKLLKDKRVKRMAVHPTSSGLLLVEFEHSIAGFDEMTTLDHFLSLRNMGGADYNALAYRNRDPFYRSTIPFFGWAATEADMKRRDPDRQLVPHWRMELYSEAVTARIAAAKKKTEKEKAEELAMEQSMEDVKEQMKADDKRRRERLAERKLRAERMEAEHISKMETLLAEERRLKHMQKRMRQVFEDQLKTTFSEKGNVGSRKHEGIEDHMRRREEEFIAEQQKLFEEASREADRAYAEKLVAVEAQEARENEEMMEMLKKKEEAELVRKEMEDDQRASEIKKQADTARKIEERQLWLGIRGRGRGQRNGNVCGSVYVKGAGSLDDAQDLWKAEYKKRFKGEDWELGFAARFSAMEDALRDMNWQPYKRDGDKMVVDKSDAKLVELGAELGEEVKESMVAALLLMEKYNPSGRFPMNVFWHAKKDVEASWEEIFNGLTQLKKKPTRKGKKR